MKLAVSHRDKIVAAKAFAALLAVGDYAAQCLVPPTGWTRIAPRSER